MKKDVIYIDLEDDITAIIEKLKASKAKIVALVPPKRSTVLNSAVNLKLLVRSSDESGKRVVLITSEKPLLSLAGGLKLHVAKNLQSKPYLPEAPVIAEADDTVIEGDNLSLDPDKPIGELEKKHKADEDKLSGKEKAEKSGEEPSKKKKIGSINKPKFKIPNFESFRTRLFIILGVVLILLIGWWWAFFVAPTASIVINAQTSRLDTSIDFTIDSTVEESDFETNVLKAESKELRKTVTEPIVATGEQNVGESASGIMTVQNCDSSDSFTIPAGTTFTSGNGLNFISAEDAAVPGGSFSGGGCDTPGEVTVNVAATAPGDQYNLASGTIYSIAGYSSLVNGFGGQMQGGTSQTITVVSQADFDKAKNALDERTHEEEKQALSELFGDGLVKLEETFSFSVGEVASVPAVGQPAEDATLTAQFVYKQYAASQSDLEKLLADSQLDKIDQNLQEVFTNGLDTATFTLQKEQSADKYDYRMRTSGFVGPKIDTVALAETVSGMRFSEVKDTVEALPGVVDSDVDFNPFWVFSAPSASQITINVNVSETVLQ